MSQTIQAILSELIAERVRIDTAIGILALQGAKRRGRPPAKRGRPKGSKNGKPKGKKA